MKKFYLLLLSVLTGLLLSVGWPANGFSFILLFALVPLLFVEDTLLKNKGNNSRFSVLLYAYLSFIIWNILTTWWIYYASLFGAVMAIVLYSLFMALVFFFFHVTRRNIYKGSIGYLALIAYWITFEYLHLDWDLSWSWLNLGNGFSNYYKFIQWYEFTGSLGGSLWILLSNILIFHLIKITIDRLKNRKRFIINLVGTLMMVFIPLIISYYIYINYTETNNPVEIVVVQPNIDPYNEKFGGMSTDQQIEKILNLAREKVTPNTRFIVAPETALPEGVWVDELNNVPSIKKIKSLLLKYPKASVVIGASTYKLYKEKDKNSSSARKYPGMDASYDAFNSALYIDTSLNIGVYNKSKLVPGVEKMPFPKIFGFLEKFAIDLGGTSGSLGTQDERTAFCSANNMKVAPVICYESIYGEFITGYIKNGAQLIFIITNDGWWKDTPGYRQHCTYASLRAIETRRSIARSANTGTSCFVNQRGDRFQLTKWWQPDVISQSINANDKLTFYVKHGDYIGRILCYISLLLGLFTIASIVINRKKSKL